MQSSIADIADLKQLSLPLPRSSVLGKHIIRLQEIAEVGWQNLGPSHFIGASGFPYIDLHTRHKSASATEREGRGAGIFIQTSHNLQLFQQLMLFNSIRLIVGGTDAVKKITYSGGTYLSVIGTMILLCTFFSAGLLLSAYLKTSFTFHTNGTLFLYILSWALVLTWHTVFQIPLSPSRCIGIFIAVPGIITLFATGTHPWMRQAIELCTITLAAAAVIIGLGTVFHGIVDGAVQQGIHNILHFNPTLLEPRPAGALFSPVTFSYAQVLHELCSFLSWGMLLSGLDRATQYCSALP